MSRRPIGAAAARLHVRMLGRVRYDEALALQHGLHRHGRANHLLLLEHPHVYTMGVRARAEHLLFAAGDPALAGVEVVRADRGGDVTYHGPGQLVGYPICNVALHKGAIPEWVASIEQLVIDALTELGLPGAGRLEGYPGVWLDPDTAHPRKICAIGVRVARGRSMHGFALNVAPDLGMFAHIVPCGIPDKAVTSLQAEGVRASVREVADVVARLAATRLAIGDGVALERQDETPPGAAQAPTAPAGNAGDAVAPEPARLRRLRAAGVDAETAVTIGTRKPDWLRVDAHMGADYLALRRRIRELSLVTVCEEAGCPNIYECWADGTATFMINGERCTRACGFCLVDTRHPLALDPDEPMRVAEAVSEMALDHAVVTAVARDDLPDGGAGAFAATIAAIKSARPTTRVEVLISDCKGDQAALRTVFDARPDVLNHNLETVLRLQRAVRPSASYARSLAVLARAKAAGLTTKSGIMVGLGESRDEMLGALGDLAGIGVDILTIGQYLRPSAAHLPVARFWTPEEFAELRTAAQEMGFAHVEASPLTRSSYHARRAADSAVVPVAAS